MARPKKEGIAYFSMDCDIFSDPSIRLLLKDFPGIGFQVFVYILCEIYKQKGYYMIVNDDFITLSKRTLFVSKKKLKEIIEYLKQVDLLDELKLDETTTVLTSYTIQKRFQDIIKSMRKKAVVDGNIWMLEQDETLECISFLSKNRKKTAKTSEKYGENITEISEKYCKNTEEISQKNDRNITKTSEKNEKNIEEISQKNEKNILISEIESIDISGSSDSFIHKNNAKTMQKSRSYCDENEDYSDEFKPDFDVEKKKKKEKKREKESDNNHILLVSDAEQVSNELVDNGSDVFGDNEVFIVLPTSGTKKEYPVTLAMVKEYQELYPAVDVEQELRGMRGWCISNPTNRKTYRGIPKFINSWLSRNQNSGGSKYSKRNLRNDEPRGVEAAMMVAAEMNGFDYSPDVGLVDFADYSEVQ